MFCGNCGNEIKDNSAFCPECGEKIETSTVNTVQGFNDGNSVIKQKLNAKGLIILIGIILVLIVLVVITISLFGDDNYISTNGYSKTLDKYYKAIENNDAELMLSSVTAKYWIDYINADYADNYALEKIQDSIDDIVDNYNCGDNIKITYEVKSEKRATKEELEELEDNIYDWYGYYVYEKDEFSITDAYVLQIDLTVVGDERSREFNYPDGFLIIKENGKWKVPRGGIATSFYDNQ